VIGKIYAHGFSQGTLSLAQGGRFHHGFISAAFTAGLAPGIQNSARSDFSRIVASSVVGGTASVLGGGKFANGAVTGAFVMLFNHMMHPEEGESEQSRIEPENLLPSADNTRVVITIPNDHAIKWENDNGIPDALGPTLIALGYPLDILKSVGALGSTPGSSIASVTLRKTLPFKLPGGLKLFGTRGMGASIGRAVPYAGWIVTGLDVATTPPHIISMPMGWSPSFAPVDNTRIVKTKIIR
jgi:hypothetical protein